MIFPLGKFHHNKQQKLILLIVAASMTYPLFEIIIIFVLTTLQIEVRA